MTCHTPPTALCTSPTLDHETLPGLRTSASARPFDGRREWHVPRRDPVHAGRRRAVEAFATARVAFARTNGSCRYASGGL